MMTGSGRYASATREGVLFALSLGLVALVGIAIAGGALDLFIAILLSAAVATAFIRWLFPEAPFFSLTFANLIALYASIFSFFIQELFARIGPFVAGIGFSLPILFFLGGCWLRRADVRSVVDNPDIRGGLLPGPALAAARVSRRRGRLSALHVLRAARQQQRGVPHRHAVDRAIVLAVSRNVAVFLVDAGLLFEEFLQRMSRLAIPAFAFLTFYSLLVIVFAAIYCIVSQHSSTLHFRADNIARALSYSEAIHFSIATLSTVGYGDIVPVSNAVRVLASIEVICGVMLLLFGVSELLEYTREHRRDHPGSHRGSA